MSASSSNSKDVDEVNPCEDNWVVTDVRTAYSKYRTTSALRVLLDSQDILDPSILNLVFFLAPLHNIRPSIPRSRAVIRKLFLHVYLCYEGLLCLYTIRRLLYGRVACFKHCPY